jgi:XTP/dITP diphosphohydrolase
MIERLPNLVLATGNQGKIREFRSLLSVLPFQLMSLLDFDNVSEVEETGTTYLENARLKAEGFARQTGYLSLADDSGLEIEALTDAPGVQSARFAGVDAGYDVKIPKLLALLEQTGDPTRRARFVCSAALSDASGKILYTAEGVCPGTIAEAPRGSGGFGYDSIFIPDGHRQTFGELSEVTKQQISHRARAVELIIRYLLDYTAV